MTSAARRRPWLAVLCLALLPLLALPAVRGQEGEGPPPAEAPEDGPAMEAPEGEGPPAGTEAEAEDAPPSGVGGPEREAPVEAEPEEGGGRHSLADLKRGTVSSSWSERVRSVFGMVFLLGICLLMSNNRKAISWRLVGWGIGLQLLLGVFVMRTDAGRWLFGAVNDLFVSLMGYTAEGAGFLFGKLATINNVPVGEGGPFGPVSGASQVAEIGAYFAFGVLPTIIFFSSLMAVLYHVGFMQLVVKAVAQVMQRTMGTSGSETLSASGNIFVGQTEAPLLVRPFVKGMTQSELMAVMTGGFATVAGGVMAAYVGMLMGYFEGIAGHLLSASVMSAPAALVCAKLIVPEPYPEKSQTYGELKVELKKVDANVIDAAARGAGDGLQLALNVGAMLLAFIALVAMFNGVLGWAANQAADVVWGDTWEERVSEAKAEWARLEESEDAEARAAALEAFAALAAEAADLARVEVSEVTVLASATEADLEGTVLTVGPGAFDAASAALPGLPEPDETGMGSTEVTVRGLNLQTILGWLLMIPAYLMGVPWADADKIGQLIGIKTVLNEFVAYLSLADMLQAGTLSSGRSVVIATYALCGFANFGSIAIQIGGIGGIAPERRSDLAKLGLRAMIGGTIAALLTATVAGLLV